MKTTLISLMSVKPDTLTPVVCLLLLLAYWQDIYFGQLTEMALIFCGFYEFNLDYDRNLTDKKKPYHDLLPRKNAA